MDETLRTPGAPLDPLARDLMEARLGYDFGHVRVHTDRRAGASATTIGARAYTVGNRVVFGDGNYSPRTRDGLSLLAHELTHVVQQSTGRNRWVQRDLEQEMRERVEWRQRHLFDAEARNIRSTRFRIRVTFRSSYSEFLENVRVALATRMVSETARDQEFARRLIDQFPDLREVFCFLRTTRHDGDEVELNGAIARRVGERPEDRWVIGVRFQIARGVQAETFEPEQVAPGAVTQAEEATRRVDELRQLRQAFERFDARQAGARFDDPQDVRHPSALGAYTNALIRLACGRRPILPFDQNPRFVGPINRRAIQDWNALLPAGAATPPAAGEERGGRAEAAAQPTTEDAMCRALLGAHSEGGGEAPPAGPSRSAPRAQALVGHATELRDQARQWARSALIAAGRDPTTVDRYVTSIDGNGCARERHGR